MSLYSKILNLIVKKFCTPTMYARYLGVKLGNNCNIYIKEWPSEPYLISIGDNVAITKGVHIHTHGGARVARAKYPNFDVFGKVEIGEGVYVGTNSQIMPGVTIGAGSLIAAGSIVTKSVPARSIVAGNPAKVIGTIDDYITHNLKYNLNCKFMNSSQKKKFLLSLDSDKFMKK